MDKWQQALSQAEEAVAALKQAAEQRREIELALLPRREEILAVIREHPRCTFDFLGRHFAGTNPKTLHYDLQCLLKKSLIRKLGVTRGVVYEAILN